MKLLQRPHTLVLFLPAAAARQLGAGLCSALLGTREAFLKQICSHFCFLENTAPSRCKFTGSYFCLKLLHLPHFLGLPSLCDSAPFRPPRFCRHLLPPAVFIPRVSCAGGGSGSAWVLPEAAIAPVAFSRSSVIVGFPVPLCLSLVFFHELCSFPPASRSYDSLPVPTTTFPHYVWV